MKKEAVVEVEVEEEEVETMVLGDLMRTPGGGGFPKQLAAISTDPIKINERAACESKSLRRPGCSFRLYLLADGHVVASLSL